MKTVQLDEVEVAYILGLIVYDDLNSGQVEATDDFKPPLEAYTQEQLNAAAASIRAKLVEL